MKFERHCVMSKRKNGEGAITKSGHISISKGGKLRYEHILIAENAIGRTLPKGSQVHHVDGNPSNNDNSNLVICQDQKYHRLLHSRTNAINAGHPPEHRMCFYCREYDDVKNLSRSVRIHFHKECRSRYRRSIYKERSAYGKSV
jgi:hypothetical protein